jgi:CHAT domain-containing protein
MEMMQIMRTMAGTKDHDEKDRKARVEALSSQISNVLLAPFAEIIRRKRHIIFSVSEPLSAFPFSMLDFDGRPLITHAAVSQTPSLKVLYHLSQRSSQSTAPTVSVFTKALSQDSYPADTRNTKEVALPMAGIEAVNISNMFSTWVYLSLFSVCSFRFFVSNNNSQSKHQPSLEHSFAITLSNTLRSSILALTE